MAANPLYLVRLDAVPLESLGAVLSICNSIVQSDRGRAHHEMAMTPHRIYPADRLPRKVRKNLTLEQANELVADLAQTGATASIVEQK